jgi:hypothetical protein
MYKYFTIALSFVLLLSMCKTQNAFVPDYSPGPPAIVYKTKKDYSKNVPVLLSEDKSKIVGYFSPNDLFLEGKLACPILLEDGFLLDNIGINKNVAYTSLELDSYSKSMQAFGADKLFELIIDDDPLMEMYNCGNRSKMKNSEEYINSIINNKDLKDCEKLK